MLTLEEQTKELVDKIKLEFYKIELVENLDVWPS